ncbi:tRNA A37 threonylcarbamoyladenosine synthetase subunit TsaC/SUA5/YrdC [Actinobaculum suis]|uniref:Translation factor (SUA5) n=1 Tax=Actinobaculum suis TaxID=1657 RepID=A0A1G7CFF7_9ACTO|nr:Sua5/YciO/YrdC/YwlC family protein [Actinobaculum suis]SDE37155.1 tRNA A37 threonylcarbamoyladenosine synthetase subunit TsaC/SUA5/YrdC [Actinobaculum suis]VDG77082.1 Putative translation factor (SUA5) [Actinobaculum suis]
MGKQVHWDGQLNEEAIALYREGGKITVIPTKVGYIIGTVDRTGLERKFRVKHRALNKPAVVLVGSMEELRELAQLTPEIEGFYQECWDRDILMGCILPWRPEAEKYIPEGAKHLVQDGLGTSCFVLKFGVPGEQIAAKLWEEDKTILFASSANPSGKGNRGLVEGIGEEIATEADLIIAADEYPRSIQPTATEESRWGQGIMVSMVDREGKLIPEQHGKRNVEPCPTFIRKGIYNEEVLEILVRRFNSWNFRQGAYY